MSTILYKSIISDDLRKEILSYYYEKESELFYSKNGTFPSRKFLGELPFELANELIKQLSTNKCIKKSSTNFVTNTFFICITYSNRNGTKKPK
jgi:arginyl-tRNA synthetase